MDNKRSFTNETASAVFIGGKLLQPGETREFSEHELPGEHKLVVPETLAPEVSLTERLTGILAGTVASVSAVLAGLDREALELMLTLEEQGAHRIGVGRAIDAELIARASAVMAQETENTRLAGLELAKADLGAAQALLDAEGDTHKHPALEAAVAAAKARVEALSLPEQA